MRNQNQTSTYLDHNATSPCKDAVIEAMTQCLGRPTNPSSVHTPGRAAHSALEAARVQVAALVGLGSDQAWRVVFTSGATEATNTIHYPYSSKDPVWVSAIEHAATMQSCDRGAEYKRIPVTADGVLDLDVMQDWLKQGKAPKLLSLMAVNNETGVIQPVSDAARLLKDTDAKIHCDAVQAPGRIDVDFTAWGVDSLCLSSHKIAGPQGVGAIVLKQGEGFHGMIHGGGQEKRRRAGTENLAGIVGFGVAAHLAKDNHDAMLRQTQMRDDLQERLEKLCGGHIRIIGKNAPRVGNTLCLTIPGLAAEKSLMALDLGGVAVSSGSACSSGTVKASHVLLAMGLDKAEAETALRISFGWDNQESDLDHFMDVWTPFYNRVKERL